MGQNTGWGKNMLFDVCYVNMNIENEILQTKETTKPVMKEKGIMKREWFENRKCNV